MKRFVLTMILLVTTALPCFGQSRYREPAFFLSLGRRSADPALYALLQQIVTNQHMLLQRDRGNDPAVTAALQSLSVAVQTIADNQQQILLLLNDLRKPVPDVEGWKAASVNNAFSMSFVRSVSDNRRLGSSFRGHRSIHFSQVCPPTR